jgi:N-acetylglucosaminyl-diphospho-decaprenol L-rhamnosyltransferase
MPMPQSGVLDLLPVTQRPAALPKGQEGDAPDISVCIVNWNCRDLLHDCLESLRRQPPSVSWEVIVVDNASTDGAADMVARDFREVVLLRNANNVGFSRANNQAARLSRGRYLLFLNNDTLVPAGALKELVHYAAAHPDFGILGPKLRDPRGKIQVSYRQMITVPALLHRTALFRWTGLFSRHYLQCRRQFFDPDSTRAVEVLMGAAMLLPRQVLFDAGMWDEGYTFGGEDMDLCYRVGRSLPVIYHPGIEIIHHGRASTRQHPRFASTNIPAGFVRFLRKTNSSRLELLLYKCVVTLDGPLQMLANGWQFLFRRFLGQTQKAHKSLRAFKSSWYFLANGLWEFWKA